MHFSTYAGGRNGYWQQQVNYKIQVDLNDVEHVLEGNIQIQYINNSPDTLRYIFFHLYPNAYKNYQTAYSKQQLINHKLNFWFSKAEDKGWIEGLNFKVNEETALFEINDTFIDIGKLWLNQPLLPNQSIEIYTPFKVQIPKSFSRMGHVGKSYQISQWYPKPAVYDENGWHPMPYLDQGEFYSEYGNYDVQIAVPKNYIVASTGSLISEDRQKDVTVHHYKQPNVHDFAWFADTNFIPLSDSFTIGSSRIKSEIFYSKIWKYNQSWKHGLDYIKNAVEFYSEEVGEYQLPKVAAVQGALKAGDGMEYPSIAVISGNPYEMVLDEIMAHEIGHNWFYGFLGSNERKYPWMDEGLNSFYEMKYMRQKYGNQSYLSLVPFAKALGFHKFKWSDAFYYGYRKMAMQKTEQPIMTSSEDFTDFNYGMSSYGKMSLALMHLENYLGEDSFKRNMQQYFKDWNGKHPSPSDFEFYFNKEHQSDWMFNDLMKSDKTIDYSIGKISKHRLTLINKGEIPSPFKLHIVYRDHTTDTMSIEGFYGMKQIETDKFISKAIIDPNECTLDINHSNNYASNRLFRKPLQWRIIPGIVNPAKKYIFITPTVGANATDRTMVGLAIYNNFMLSQKMEMVLNPMYATHSKSIVGNGYWNIHLYSKSKIHILPQLNFKRYSFQEVNDFSNFSIAHLFYNKVAPSLTIEFQTGEKLKPIHHQIYLRNNHIFYDEEGQTAGVFSISHQYYQLNELGYVLSKNSALFGYSFEGKLVQRDEYLNVQTTLNLDFKYLPKGHLKWRIFGGVFPFRTPNTNIGIALSNGSQRGGYMPHDYAFDEVFLSRSYSYLNTFASRQIAKTEGGFRSVLNFGLAERMLLSTNLELVIPKIPIKPFVSVAVGDFLLYNDMNQYKAAFEMGLSIVAFKEILELHMPIYTSSNLLEDQSLIGADNFFKRITFTINLKNWNWWKIMNTGM